jgi:6,7-dimethyl-8-ribityllumazine synthase
MVATGLRFGIVVSRFNDLVTERLLDGALDALRRHGGDEAAVEIVRVPGAWEIPLAAQALAKTGRFDGVVCLGCVIKGATDHYDYVCSQTSSGIMNVGLQSGLPVTMEYSQPIRCNSRWSAPAAKPATKAPMPCWPRLKWRTF